MRNLIEYIAYVIGEEEGQSVICFYFFRKIHFAINKKAALMLLSG